MVLSVDILAYLTAFLDLALVASVIYFVLKKLGYDLADRKYISRFKDFINEFNRWIALIIALTASLGSLYLSNFLGWEPCRLCWFQRIFMYPLVLILGTGILTEDKDMKDYVLPLLIIGIPIAFIHSLIQRYDQFQSAGCSITSISCATEYTFHFGYITIPVMALTAFLGILVLIWRYE